MAISDIVIKTRPDLVHLVVNPKSLIPIYSWLAEAKFRLRVDVVSSRVWSSFFTRWETRFS